MQIVLLLTARCTAATHGHGLGAAIRRVDLSAVPLGVTVCASAGARAAPIIAAEPAAAPTAALAIVSWRKESEPETVVPDVSLTRSRDGSTGTATFRFLDPSITRSIHDVWNNGLITGLWLRDEEGFLVTTDLEANFERGRPRGVTAILVLKSSSEWDRFMRFMKRYAEANSLQFEPSS